METEDGGIKRARDAIARAGRITVLTGAGISAESGIPTFRDALTGLWSRFRPEELATPEAFVNDPRLVWDWYAWRRAKVAEVAPNPGHFALAELQRVKPLTLITQNVDGLHQQAGSRDVIELHGNIRRVKCFDHGHEAQRWDEGGDVPRCARCGSLLRPDVVWFGEMLPKDAIARAVAAAGACEVFLSIGTSSMVEPAASLPVTAKTRGAVLIEINPAATPVSGLADIRLQGASGVILPQLLQPA